MPPRRGLVAALLEARTRGDAEGTRDATRRRAPVRATALPMDARAAGFARALDEMFSLNDLADRENDDVHGA